MSQKIRIGVLGAASIAERSVIPSLIKLSHLYELEGIASRNYNKSEALALKFNSKPYIGYQSILDNPHVDAVYIPLPNSLHKEWVEKSLLAGKHVLVEKSLTCTLEETLELSNLAVKLNLIVVENFQFRLHPQLSKIKQLIIDGAIGDIRCLRSSFGFPPFLNTNNIRYQSELGGGALLDAGAYPIKISQLILGNDLEVDGASLVFDANKNIDIAGAAQLRNSSGAVAQLAFGFDNFYQCNLEVWGSKGKLSTNRIFTAPSNHVCEIFLENDQGVEKLIIAPYNQFVGMLQNFYQMIITGANCKDELTQNINQARIISEIKRISYEQA
jgi:NDP-hexose-3-ketoreductase